ncbi:MAG: sugar phosphate isomerase/epimerase family protein [Fimbriiglobus sp.]
MFWAMLGLCLVPSGEVKIWEPANLVAWCIVPFDAKNRTPADRAEMLQKLGFQKFAYDWRANHLPTFETEILELKKRQIELTAVWFPAGLNAEAKTILAALEKHKLTPQLWVMIPDPAPGQPHEAKLKASVKQLTPIAEAAGKIGCRLSIYNHGNWGGQPGNMVAIVEAMKRDNVGIVYNLHHGHEHLPDFANHLKLMLPKLHCLNVNGMDTDGERRMRKIRVWGTGERDAELMKLINDSGYRGPIGILGHTNDDAEARLADNLAGLKALLAGKPIPELRTQPKSAKP